MTDDERRELAAIRERWGWTRRDLAEANPGVSERDVQAMEEGGHVSDFRAAQVLEQTRWMDRHWARRAEARRALRTPWPQPERADGDGAEGAAPRRSWWRRRRDGVR